MWMLAAKPANGFILAGMVVNSINVRLYASVILLRIDNADFAARDNRISMYDDNMNS